MPGVQPRWSFEERDKKRVRRDPFEAEFFTGEEETEEAFGRTDGLVREAIQNSLDARMSDTAPVRVRIALSRSPLSSKKASRYLDGLVPHLDARGNETVNQRTPHPSMDYLVVEDSNTRGLCGDPALTEDPDQPDPDNPESFYWFWRNVGRSGKTGQNRGRWGLGKTVFPSCSRINTMFGLTVRATDHKQLLMGQAILRIHKIGSREYEPEGFFAEHTSDLQMPIRDSKLLEQFKKDFGLKRGSESGLSIVVPYVFPQLQGSEILRSVIVHYFYPILRGDLVVDVEGPDVGAVSVDKKSIRKLADDLEWKGGRKEKKHAPPPFELAAWAIENPTVAQKNILEIAREPDWSEELISEDRLEPLRERYLAQERVALRVPLIVELKDGKEKVSSYFDVFLELDPSLERGEDYFVREGMTISRVSTLNSQRNVRGLVIIEDRILSTLLGDAEGPAHTEWGTGESRPDQTFVRWKRRITFVRLSLTRILRLLSPPPDTLDRNLLKDIFSINLKAGTGKKRGRSGPLKKDKDQEPPAPPPPPRPPRFQVSRIQGGFRVHPASTQSTPRQLVLVAAYDVSSGSPKDLWSEFDFSFEPKKGRGQLSIQEKGLRVVERTGNRMVIEISKPRFELSVTGFDPFRDLLIDCKEIDETEVEK
jgi:hypothetical protein